MQPSPLTEGTRRFLRPIVGIDPADVRVYRGAVATQITEAYSADGLNSGDAIVLGPGNEDETRPETLGLLAHELTHAAQRGEVGYIPPIAQGRVPVTATPEDIAQIAEQAARRAARRFAAPAIGRQASAPASQPNNENERAASVPDELDTSESPDRSRWGELPAPWEPLPTWDDAAPAVEAPVPLRSSSTPRAAALLAAPVEASAPILPAVALAEVNRAIGDGEQSQPASGHESQQPAPDLDALARQVYDMLKQRLATERRRLG
jgi:hypothetical protein